MSEYEEMLRHVADAVQRPVLERFGEVRVADYEDFTEEKKREYREALTQCLAWELLTSSSLLRHLVRKWGADEFNARLSDAIVEASDKLSDVTNEFLRR